MYDVYVVGFDHGDHQRAGAELQRLFGLDPNTALDLVKRLPRYVKRNISGDTAVEFQYALEKAGALVELHKADPDKAKRPAAQPATDPVPDNDTAPTPAPPAPAHSVQHDPEPSGEEEVEETQFFTGLPSDMFDDAEEAGLPETPQPALDGLHSLSEPGAPKPPAAGAALREPSAPPHSLAASNGAQASAHPSHASFSPGSVQPESFGDSGLPAMSEPPLVSSVPPSRNGAAAMSLAPASELPLPDARPQDLAQATVGRAQPSPPSVPVARRAAAASLPAHDSLPMPSEPPGLGTGPSEGASYAADALPLPEPDLRPPPVPSDMKRRPKPPRRKGPGAPPPVPGNGRGKRSPAAAGPPSVPAVARRQKSAPGSSMPVPSSSSAPPFGAGPSVPLLGSDAPSVPAPVRHDLPMPSEGPAVSAAARRAVAQAVDSAAPVPMDSVPIMNDHDALWQGGSMADDDDDDPLIQRGVPSTPVSHAHDVPFGDGDSLELAADPRASRPPRSIPPGARRSGSPGARSVAPGARSVAPGPRSGRPGQRSVAPVPGGMSLDLATEDPRTEAARAKAKSGKEPTCPDHPTLAAPHTCARCNGRACRLCMEITHDGKHFCVKCFGPEFAGVRAALVAHEGALRSLGLAYALMGVGMMVAGIHMMVAGGPRPSGWEGARELLALISVGLMWLISGVGLRALKPWAKTPILAFSAVCTLLVPVGTLVDGFFIKLLASGHTATVLSPAYADAIRATPKISPAPKGWMWLLLAAKVAFLVWLATAMRADSPVIMYLQRFVG